MPQHAIILTNYLVFFSKEGMVLFHHYKHDYLSKKY